MVKQDDSHKEILSSGFSKTKCKSLYFPKMVTTISSMSHALLLSVLTSSNQVVAPQSPSLEPGPSSAILQIGHSSRDFTWDWDKVIRCVVSPHWAHCLKVHSSQSGSSCCGIPSQGKAHVSALVSSPGLMPSPHQHLGESCERVCLHMSPVKPADCSTH